MTRRSPATLALDYAMPEGEKHSHSLEIKLEISMRGYRFGIAK